MNPQGYVEERQYASLFTAYQQPDPRHHHPPRPCMVCGVDTIGQPAMYVPAYITINGQNCGRTHFYHVECYKP